MATYPLINGFAYDYSSIEIDLGEAGIFTGIKEISYSQSVEPGIVRGTSAQKLARTRGEHDAEGSIVFYTREFIEFITSLTGGDENVGYMDQSFNITLTYSNPQVPLTTVRLIGVRIKSEEGGGSQGTDPLEVSCDLDIMRIETNGLSPLSNMLR
jgi:hypothetical protein